MSDDRLEVLLEKLNSGDATAAEEVFLAYEPYLRMVVRRQLSTRLRARFDSVDIVQSVWADVLEGFRETTWRFADAAHLRAFLIRAVRNRFIDRLRQNVKSMEHERSFAESDPEDLPRSRDPRPSEFVQADDLWEQLLALCPPDHHELLRLKQQGLPLAEIGARTGLHESSVRRILYDLARRLDSRRSQGR